MLRSNLRLHGFLQENTLTPPIIYELIGNRACFVFIYILFYPYTVFPSNASATAATKHNRRGR